MPQQGVSSAGARARTATGLDRRSALDQLQNALVAGRNADGGWGYYAGKASRLEPTCWARLALGAAGTSGVTGGPATAWLAQCQRSAGWLVENPDWPVNIAFNALAAFTLLQHPDPTGEALRQRLLAAVIASKGTPAPPAEGMRQDNSLQGWSWIDATFSWVEPTCWGLLALKKAGKIEERNQAGSRFFESKAGEKTNPGLLRIAEAERLLVDRTCQPGGWNFGNASVMRQDLRPYVPTTALGLLAMQDRRDEPAVVRSLAFLEAHWQDEISAPSLGLSLVCLGVYGRPTDRLVARLVEHVPQALAFGNYHGIALAWFALSSVGQPHAFRL